MAHDDAALRREMVDTCRRMNATGMSQGTAGSLSVRCDGGFLIPPTSLPYDAMTPDDLVRMDGGGTYEGPRRLSSEWRFHREILSARRDVDCVLRCHSVYATTLACLLGQHGQIALGKTPPAALAVEVETLSRLYVQALVLGEPPVLPDDEMARVIQQLRNMSYGHAPDLDDVNDTARPKAAS